MSEWNGFSFHNRFGDDNNDDHQHIEESIVSYEPVNAVEFILEYMDMAKLVSNEDALFALFMTFYDEVYSIGVKEILFEDVMGKIEMLNHMESDYHYEEE